MNRRPVAVLLCGAVPWVVVAPQSPGWGISLVFAFGLVDPMPVHVTMLPAYLLVYTRGLPPSLLAWPVATLLYGLGLASVLVGRFVGREDRRVTAGLLVLAGLSLLLVAGAVGRTAGVYAVPVGSAALWFVAWWADGDALVRIVRGVGAPER